MINTEALAGVADAMATALGFPGYRYAVVPHPIGSLDAEQVRQRAKLAAPQVLALLRGLEPDGAPRAGADGLASTRRDATTRDGAAAPRQDATTRDAAAAPRRGATTEMALAVELIEQCFEDGFSDGLPVVPPVRSLVERFLATTTRGRDEVLWAMPELDRECTVETAAVNAAMAGCRPEYFPVVLAAVDAIVDEGALVSGGGAGSSSGGGPLLVVNGPGRLTLGFNSGGNVFGPGYRANATVGRAIRLILMNAFGVRPPTLDQSLHGNPLKYTCCIAENEESSPWAPLHVDLGYDPGQTTVSALWVRSVEHVDNRRTTDATHLLNDIADTMGRSGATTRQQWRQCVVLGPMHAKTIAAAGMTKQDVKAYLAGHAGKRQSELARVGKQGFAQGQASAREEGMPPQALVPARPGEVPVVGDEFVLTVADPANVLVVVAGGTHVEVSSVLQPFTGGWKVPGSAAVGQR